MTATPAIGLTETDTNRLMNGLFLADLADTEPKRFGAMHALMSMSAIMAAEIRDLGRRVETGAQPAPGAGPVVATLVLDAAEREALAWCLVTAADGPDKLAEHGRLDRRTRLHMVASVGGQLQAQLSKGATIADDEAPAP